MKAKAFRNRIAATAAAVALAATGAFTVTTMNAAPAQANSKCVDNVYKYGGYGTCVGYLQTMLNYDNPHSQDITVDNSYGSNTRSAVKYFQRWNALDIDGVVGPKTWKKLCKPSQRGTNYEKPVTFTGVKAAAGCNSLF